jgi:LuxR family maltose regulon positive regulatory protein
MLLIRYQNRGRNDLESDLLLVTKLAQPRVVRYHLVRPHLQEILTEGLDRRLTTLVAAAGHGKTCTLAHFLAESKVPYLWMQLDAGDSDQTTFLHYLAQGIAHQLGGGSRLAAALRSSLPAKDLVPLLLADLQQSGGPIGLVLDDFHLIAKDSPVVQLISSLLQYADQNLHCFICSRTPLPFPTARLKVLQEAGEITEEDLRFTPSEVAEFMRVMAGIPLSDGDLEQICHLTEGWSAALVLLASGLKRRSSVQLLLRAGLPSDLFAFLADELFHSLDPSVQLFMEESVVLEVCSPEVCDAILERTDSELVLQGLLSANLLLTQLGENSFRYHHLLQRFLLERLRRRDGSKRFRELHKRTGDWFLTADLPEEAIRYYLRADWVWEAANLVEHLAPLWLRTNRLERLRGLLGQLPTETKEQYPWISLCEARHALSSGSPETAMGLARLALRAFEEKDDQRGCVQAHTIIGEIQITRQQYEAATDAYKSAAALLQPDYRYEEGLLLLRRAQLTISTRGGSSEAEDDLRRALAIYVEIGDLPGEAAASDLLGLLRGIVGDYNSAVTFLKRATEILLSLGEPQSEVGTNLASLYAQAAQFAEAVALCEPIVTNSTRKIRRAFAAVTLVQAYTRLGEFTKASAMVQTAAHLSEELGHSELKASLCGKIAAMYRLSGQPEAAVPYANEAAQIAKHVDRPHVFVKPMLETILLHLFQTGNAAAAARVAGKALDRMGPGPTHPISRMELTFALAIAEFRQSRTESRPEAVRLLQEGLAECGRRGYEFFVLHEWTMGLSVIIYSLAYGVQLPLCQTLLARMCQRLPSSILEQGIPLADAESRLIPAAYQALPDGESRTWFTRLLCAADRRRTLNLVGGPAPLRIQCLGPLSLTVGAEVVDIKALKRRKAGVLLVLLLVEEGTLPREQVIERLWPDLDPGAADTSLRVALHHLRRLLEPQLGGRSRSRYLQTEGGLIWFDRQTEVQVDLHTFRDALEQAVTADADGDLRRAADAYEKACSHYRGDLSADDPYSSALEDLRLSLKMRYLAALDWLGTYYWREVQDGPKAILAYKRRLAVDEADEATHQALMRLYLETGQVTAARQQYERCRGALAEQLGAPPSRATDSLLQLILSMESETHGSAIPVKRGKR